MLRSGAARTLPRAFGTNSALVPRKPFVSTASKLQSLAQSRALSFKSSRTLALTLHKPASLSLRRYATTGSPSSGPDKKLEEKLRGEKLPQTPETVTTGSSVRHVLHEEPAGPVQPEPDMMAGVRSDFKTIKETFTLQEVPKEALYIGLAGVIPYLATSLSTVYLAWDMNYAAHHGTGFLLSGKNAELLLQLIEPLQIGYGAVIISFLGAIHWGLEWAKFGGEHGYSRYAVGVVAPAIAWPTLLLPVEQALIAQFLAFNYLYFTDSRAARKGTAPHWYGVYRFVLTFIVGASIVASLVGRGQIVESVGHPSNAVEKVKALRSERDTWLAKEEEEKKKALAEQEEEEDDE